MQIVGWYSIVLVMMLATAIAALGSWQLLIYRESFLVRLHDNGTFDESIGVIRNSIELLGGRSWVGLLGISFDEQEEPPDLADIAISFALGKTISFAILLPLTEAVMFCLARRSQMKPDDAANTLSWHTGVSLCDCIRSGLGPRIFSPNDVLWNRFIGPEKSWHDLPPKAPQYLIRVHIGPCILCESRPKHPNDLRGHGRGAPARTVGPSEPNAAASPIGLTSSSI